MADLRCETCRFFIEREYPKHSACGLVMPPMLRMHHVSFDVSPDDFCSFHKSKEDDTDGN